MCAARRAACAARTPRPAPRPGPARPPPGRRPAGAAEKVAILVHCLQPPQAPAIGPLGPGLPAPRPQVTGGWQGQPPGVRPPAGSSASGPVRGSGPSGLGGPSASVTSLERVPPIPPCWAL
ncbi:hypothetical protein MC885_013523 [Smutsia gigantea]|nr:hypothetical protein MC885_013523 [Smutsia gigantea]